MDKRTSNALDLIEKIKLPGDTVYEVIREEKKSGLFYLWDILFDTIPSTTNALFNNKVMFLVASEKNGKIIEVENGNISNTIEIPNWTSDKKTNFKKVMIDKYVYKKFKKIA